MTNNKNFSLAAGAAMVLSLFLPFVKIGPIGVSLFDTVTRGAYTTESIAVMILSVGFLILTLMDKQLVARICAGLVLLFCMYSAYKMADVQAGMGRFSRDFNVFSILSIGAYLLLLGSIAGVIFSKPSK